MTKFIQAEELLSKLLFGIIVGLVFVASIGRWVGYPIPWAVDMAQLFFIWVCFFGANQALRRNQHLGVDIFYRRVSFAQQRKLQILFKALALGLLGVLIVKGIELTLLNRERVFSDSSLSYSFVTAAVPTGCFLIGLTLVSQIIGLLRGGPISTSNQNPGSSS